MQAEIPILTLRALHVKSMEQNYIREAVLQLIFSLFPPSPLLSFQLNIPSQRYLPKQPYARSRNGRAINYITAFSQVRKSRSSRSGPDQSSRGQQEAQHRALSRALRTFNYRPQSSINFVFPRSSGRLCRRAFLPSGMVTALHRFIPAVTFCTNPSVIKTARSLHA